MKLAFATLIAGAAAQVQYPFAAYSARSAAVPEMVGTMFGAMDVAELRAKSVENQKVHGGYEFAKVNEVSVNIERDGFWTPVEGGKVWSYTFASPDALTMSLTFSSFYICDGCAMFVSTPEETAGAFTKNWDNGLFATRHIKGNDLTIEVFVPESAKNTPVLEVSKVATSWRKMGEKAGTCNINAECVHPENTCTPGCVPTDRTCTIACTYYEQNSGNDQWADESWFDEVRSSGAMQSAGGSRYCSGSLLNASADGRPVFLTAHHCIGASPGSDLVLFNFRAADCNESNDNNGPTTDTAGNLNILHSSSRIDHSYLGIGENIPDSYNTYMSGFSATNSPAPATVGIHNPASSITKISHSDRATTPDSWSGGGVQDHWRVAVWTEATTEPGSSGSPLLNRETKRVVGQLHGGTAACPALNGWDSYGAVWASYDDGASSFLGPNREVDGQETSEFYRKQRMEKLLKK